MCPSGHHVPLPAGGGCALGIPRPQVHPPCLPRDDVPSPSRAPLARAAGPARALPGSARGPPPARAALPRRRSSPEPFSLARWPTTPCKRTQQLNTAGRQSCLHRSWSSRRGGPRTRTTPGARTTTTPGSASPSGSRPRPPSPRPRASWARARASAELCVPTIQPSSPPPPPTALPTWWWSLGEAPSPSRSGGRGLEGSRPRPRPACGPGG